MTEQQTDDLPEGEEFEIPPWNPQAILRRRALDARQARQAVISELRRNLTDAEILSQYGIAVDQILG